MSQTPDVPTPRHLSVSLDVATTLDAAYDLVSDQTRVGEWSPICRAVEWDEPDRAGEVGATFVGHNQTPDRTWETRSQVTVAMRPHAFAFEVGPGLVRWGFDLEEVADRVRITERWAMLDGGVEVFRRRYGDEADAQLADRAAAALEGIPATLEQMKRILEG